MFTLLVGILIVAGSAVGFGLALFGRRPIPQPAMQQAGSHLVTQPAEAPPSYVEPVGSDEPKAAMWVRRLLQRDETAQQVDPTDVTLSRWVKVRSALMLLLTVVGLAAIIGGMLSVVVVGLGLLVT